MKKVILWTILILLLLAAAVGGSYYYFYIMPYQAAASTMPSGSALTISQTVHGNLHLSWPEAPVADYYCVELQLPMTQEAIEAEEEPTVIFRNFVYDTVCILPQFADNTEYIIEISTIVEYETAFDTQKRKGDNPIRIATTLDIPTITDIQWTPDPDADTVTINFQPQHATHTRIYLQEADGSLTLLKTLEESEAQITFGESMDIPMPDHETTCTLVFDAYRADDDFTFYGYICGEMSVVRQDLLGRELNFTVTDNGHNVFTMTWDETKGEYYQLQQYDSEHDQWLTLTRIPKNEERTYTTGHLENLQDFSFRVFAVGGQTQENSAFAAQSQEVTVTTVASPIYCTIWPVKDLNAYSAPTEGEVVGKVKTAKAYCVIDEVDGMFGVMVDDTLVYIDSNYCMINLPEIYGDLIAYDITNSYSSLYMVHEYEIPNVTDVVTAGYNYVKMSNGEFLVPLLYPTAQKLFVAAQEALSRGYRLKIYDAYRPNRATTEIYDLTEEILEDPIPEKPFTNKKPKDMPEVEEDEEITYKLLMTNDTWELGSFLAKGGSLHNLGIAVDLTLEDMNGKELEMQTSIHDLSWYSTVSKNNKNAKLLAEIMTSANLGGISSEWWHFQDNDSRAQLKPPTVWAGVSPECWMADDQGWRYRRQNGNFFADCTKVINGVTYIFDAYGYATKAE